MIVVVEELGYGSCLCLYDIPCIPSFLNMTRDQLEEARKVEFRKEFIQKYGQEF